MHYILLIIGLILIIKASDILIDASKSIAIRFRIPKVLIALTIVAFGTCAPELAISFNSIMTDNGSMALANVMGSCIVNILLIIGVASISYPIKVKNQTIRKELPLLALTTLIFSIIITNGILNPYKFNSLNRFDGLLLLFLFVLFVFYIVNLVRTKDSKISNEKAQYGLIRSIIYIVASIIVISFSANMLVDSAVMVADDLRISQKVITMVAIVIGTSLPELFLTFMSAKKNEHEMAIGNIIGTNIFNICIVMGLPMFIFDGFMIVDFNLIDIGVVLLASFLLFSFVRSERTLSRKEGLFMVFIFILYYSYIIFF